MTSYTPVTNYTTSSSSNQQTPKSNNPEPSTNRYSSLTVNSSSQIPITRKDELDEREITHASGNNGTTTRPKIKLRTSRKSKKAIINPSKKESSKNSSSCFNTCHLILTIFSLIISILIALYLAYQHKFYSNYLLKLKKSKEFFDVFDKILNEEILKLVDSELKMKVGELKMEYERYDSELKNLTSEFEKFGKSKPPAPNLPTGPGLPGPPGPRGPPGVDLINCHHDKIEKLASFNVNFMQTKWLKPKPGYIFTGITCTTIGRKEAFLESRSQKISDDNFTGKEFRCSCGSAPGSLPNSLVEDGSLSSCSMHYWTCPMYEGA